MKCEFSYCVYNEEFTCILDEIQIDALGMCEACEIVAVPKETLEKYKKKRLKEIEEIWKDYSLAHPKP